ncbi:DUF817 family protein [Pararhodobacter sp.]|uniref:DUF817 family protein n=1 Tax=Pararhodobacter sp. TaxID=2127056 RepID=UPI002AFEE7F0|nr:DUF817 family protein [Pararhodobacter sp.]
MFVLKHLWAGLFGGILMIAMAVSAAIWPDDWLVTRYDALLVVAVITQVLFFTFHLESSDEGVALAVFSALGLGMEFFNTAQGNWAYPEGGLFTIAHVPLFVGFQYAAVGICILRMIRIFEMRFVPFPPYWMALGLVALIYANFFTQHLWIDIRIALFIATVLMFGRTRIRFRSGGRDLWMPMLLSLFLSALGVWLAENLGTLTGTWLYSGQEQGELVSFATLGSWYLFLCVALIVALLVLPDATQRARSTRKPRATH